VVISLRLDFRRHFLLCISRIPLLMFMTRSDRKILCGKCNFPKIKNHLIFDMFNATRYSDIFVDAIFNRYPFLKLHYCLLLSWPSLLLYYHCVVCNRLFALILCWCSISRIFHRKLIGGRVIFGADTKHVRSLPKTKTSYIAAPPQTSWLYSILENQYSDSVF